MELIPINETPEENAELASDSLWKETITVCVDFYKKVGFVPPWISYAVRQDNVLVANAAFKGQPLNGTVEIAYGTVENFMRKGIGTAVCKKLVALALKIDSSIRITARTLPEHNYSTRILEKNGFTCLGVIQDPEDGAVWEWEYKGIK